MSGAFSFSFAFHRSTPPGAGGIAVIELYGRGAEPLLGRLFEAGRLPAAGRARLGALRDLSGEPIDEAIVSRVPAAGMWCRLPAFTVSLHGGAWIQRRVCETLAAAGGRELDARGVLLLALEERALDAIEAAAFELLIEARTERAAAYFLRQHGGELSRRLAAIAELCGTGGDGGWSVTQELDALLAGSGAAYRLGRPLRVLIAGRPNSGKSTLFNALVERERVIVSADVGTTRDFIRETIALDGFPVELIDSAGLHSSPADPVEKEAISRLRREEADAVLYLVRPPWSLLPEEESFLRRFPPDAVLRVATFGDVPPGSDAERAALERFSARIAAVKGDGLDALRREVSRRWLAESEVSPERDPVAPFTERQRELVREALEKAGDPHEPGRLDAVRRVLIICLRSSWP